MLQRTEEACDKEPTGREGFSEGANKDSLPRAIRQPIREKTSRSGSAYNSVSQWRAVVIADQSPINSVVERKRTAN
ncbi:Hypothetical predicted protein [Pelobates cultripes]|uniref:Uncharacterized protein n=1 Tax=Pelobates cultripes TaxID=61616 RepID=A0AAD1RD09_PELCU|nr:Hypothetical predicted protein [Pelobates cultripes]